MSSRHPLVLALLLSMGLVTSANADLVAFYSGDGTPNDSVSGQNGTLVNGAGYGPGVTGQSFLLNGTNQYVSVPDSSTWTLGSDPFSINLMVNFNSINAGPIGSLPDVFIGHDEGGGDTNKWVFFYDGNGHLAFHINSPSLGPIFLTAPTTFSPTTDAWYDFAITRSGSTYTFYADGVSLGSATSAAAIPDANAPLTIGQAENLGYLNGSIENVGIYNQALTAPQIQRLASVPEPASAMILASGIIGTFVAGRHRSSKKRRDLRAGAGGTIKTQ